VPRDLSFGDEPGREAGVAELEINKSGRGRQWDASDCGDFANIDAIAGIRERLAKNL